MTGKQRAVIIANYFVYLLILIWVVLFHGTLETLNSAFDPDLRAVNFYLYINGFESVLNMLIFIPFGLYVGVLCEKKKRIQKIGLVAVGSLFFETAQYIFAVGATDNLISKKKISENSRICVTKGIQRKLIGVQVHLRLFTSEAADQFAVDQAMLKGDLGGGVLRDAAADVFLGLCDTRKKLTLYRLNE